MASRFRVVVTDFITAPLKEEERILGDIADVLALDAFSEDELRGKIEDADAIMLYHNLKITRPTIEKLTRCKLIVRCGVGFDNVDWRFARERGIPVGNVPDYGTEEVADSAIGLMLALTRGIHLYNSLLQPNPKMAWTYTHAKPITRLRGQVFGIVGLGRIGSAAAHRAKALGMRVAFYDPYIPDGWDKAHGVERAESLEELLTQSFVVSVHCPLTPETKSILNAKTIALMPKGSFLVNTARGAVVDTAAVADALASHHLAGAGIDVLPIEPPEENDPLIRAWRDPAHPAHHRLLVNPHAAFYSEQGLLDMRIKGSTSCRNALLGKPIRNVVN